MELDRMGRDSNVRHVVFLQIAPGAAARSGAGRRALDRLRPAHQCASGGRGKPGGRGASDRPSLGGLVVRRRARASRMSALSNLEWPKTGAEL